MTTNSSHNPRTTIRQLRQERGWTQQTLAWRLGVDQGAVSAWELGQRAPYRRTLQHLADLFGISVEDIALSPALRAPKKQAPEDRL